VSRFARNAPASVGEHLVPMPHFGLILELPDWQAMAQRLQAADTGFVLPPQIRYAGAARRAVDDVLSATRLATPIEVKGFASLDTVYSA
jgi:extradiol dioxygenase family protein